jgi:hypothetical protein
MLLSTIIYLLSSTFALSSPLHQRDNTVIPIENDPWHLSQITAFIPALNSTSPAYIKFSLIDSNDQLQLNTTCQYTSAVGVPSPATPGDGYVNCMNVNVEFKYDGSSIYIVRSYSFPDPR